MKARIIGPQECDQRRYGAPITRPPSRWNSHLATAFVWFAAGLALGILGHAGWGA